MRHRAIEAGCVPLAKKTQLRSSPSATTTAVKSVYFMVLCSLPVVQQHVSALLKLDRRQQGLAPRASAGGVWRTGLKCPPKV